MYLIVGLGNPGPKYDKTRHNMGFEVIDRLIEEHHIPQSGTKFHAMIGNGAIEGRKVLLMKPLTYMNLSGTAVAEAVHYYKLDPANDLIVISDDIDLEVGRLRIRKQGSAGGQKGLQHIIKCLGTDQFTRIRVGTGAKPEGWELADWVLSRFSEEEWKSADLALDRAVKAVECSLREGVDAAMNAYNSSKKAERRSSGGEAT